ALVPRHVVPAPRRVAERARRVGQRRHLRRLAAIVHGRTRLEGDSHASAGREAAGLRLVGAAAGDDGGRTMSASVTPNGTYDAIIVGGGPVGAHVAKELVAKNKRVLMLEAGRAGG